MEPLQNPAVHPGSPEHLIPTTNSHQFWASAPSRSTVTRL